MERSPSRSESIGDVEGSRADRVDFVIHYGLTAGFEDEALALARRLFAYFDEAIDSLALIPTPEDEFDLWLNGRLKHSFRQSGRAPRLSDVSGHVHRDEVVPPADGVTSAAWVVERR
jgi:hypothetical protein